MQENIQKMKRVYLLDYLKALAVMMVIVNHTNAISKSNPVFLLFINIAVPIFMIISGFVYCLQSWDFEIKSLFKAKTILPRLMRILRPLPIAFAAYIILECVVLRGGGY